MNIDTKKPVEDQKSAASMENNLISTPVPAVPAGGPGVGTSRLSPFGSIGRIKEPPVCRAESLTKESLNGEQLSRMCWNASPSDSSSMSCQHPDGISTSSTHVDSQRTPAVEADSKKQKYPRPTIFKRMTSRTGRETQRWATDAGTNQLFRLVTGTVPIMTDGRILFCSSSRKQEWILPKGGWEADETMEESALRETFEEAGVLGMLGPKLEEVEYETRKAKKRRLEREERIKKFKEEAGHTNGETIATSVGKQAVMPPPEPFSSAVVSVQSHSSCGASSEDEHIAHNNTASTVLEDVGNDSARNTSPVTDVSSKKKRKDVVRTKPINNSDGPHSVSVALLSGRTRDNPSNHSNAGNQNDDTASVASATSGTSDVSNSCAHVRMSLFPLYVSEVRDEWPESGRARKVMDIDAAIQMMEPRPEFRSVLVEVKKKGLHLTLPSNRDNATKMGDLDAQTKVTPANDSL